jgi:hypothetical protein
MTVEELKKKYGTNCINMMINHLMVKVPVLSPYELRIYEELKTDIKDLLK